jgi:hypothetical protein
MLVAGIQNLVAASSAVQALIGNPARFYPVVLPENPVYPCASYQVISDIPEYVLSGTKTIQQVRLQVDTWSGGPANATYLAAKNVQLAIRAALEGFRGQLLDGTNVAWIEVKHAADLYEQNARAYRTTMDYMIHFYPGANID